MTDEDWDAGFAKSLAMYLNGHGIRDTDERGEQVVDDCFFLAFNASDEAIEFTLPAVGLRRGLDGRRRHRRSRRGRAAAGQGRRDACRVHGAVDRSCCRPARVTDADAPGSQRHLPPAGHRRLPAGRRGGGGRLPGRPRRQPRLLLAAAALGGGQHARLRHRRPRAHRRAARRARRAWTGSWPRCTSTGLGLVLDIVPNHMGVADAGRGAVVVGRAAARPRQRARRRVRHRLGLRRRPGAPAGARRRRTTSPS